MNVNKFFSVLTFFLTVGTVYPRSSEMADSLSQQLQEVVVTAGQPATKLVGSTLISTIVGTNLAQLGNALDVLAQLPMIKVSDNSVEVIGKSNIEIYIDGRPLRDEEELMQLLSSDMKRVELLMAPGSAYQATTGAVLKIYTRRNFVKGLSLTDRFQFQNRRKCSVMEYFGASYHTRDWEVFVNGTVNYNNSLIKGTTLNSLVYNGRATVVGSTQASSYPVVTGVVKGGFNYSQGKRSFGAYYRVNPETGDFHNSGSEWLDDNAPLDRDINKNISARSHLASIYYEDTFSEKYLLHFDGDFRSSIENNDVTTSYPASTVPRVNSADTRKSTLWAGKLYMNIPVWSGDLTLGTQDSYTHTSLDYRMLNPSVSEYIPSSMTDARQTSAAVFATWSRVAGNFTFSAGARYEYVDYDFKVNGRREDDLSRRDHTVTPDLSIGYSFNYESQVSLSYKMATVKPPYSQLTGSLSYTGRHEIEGGNPALSDERMHDLQLFGMWNGFMIQADYTRSLDTYAFVKQIYPADNLQLLMHPVNIDVTALNLYPFPL